MVKKKLRYSFAVIAVLLWAVVFFEMPRYWVFSALAKSFDIAGISAVPNAIKKAAPEKIAAERDELRTRVSALESQIREQEKLGTLAVVESIPPQSPYDIILIQAGLGDHIEKGQKVVKNGILLGAVEEAGRGHAKVKLLSYPKFQTEAFLESGALNITLEGYGGLNMIFQAPKDLEVKIGEKVLSNTSPSYLIGEVGYIKSKESDPLQTVYIRPPLNLRHIRSVEIVP